MPDVSTQAVPCSDPHCSGQHLPAERIALADSLCSERGVKLTDLRRTILELLWESGRATGAYNLIEALKQRKARPIAPPTVYRSLEFLILQGLVLKIESWNAYIPCMHPEHKHDCLFFLCSECGASVAAQGVRLERLIAEEAADIDFRPTRKVIEVEGVCADCTSAGAD